MSHKAWNNVTGQTIHNCFGTCGFVKAIDREEDKALATLEVDSQWHKLSTVPVEQLSTFAEFVAIDNDLAICGVLNDEDILNKADDEEECCEDPPQTPENNNEKIRLQRVAKNEVDVASALLKLAMFKHNCWQAGAHVKEKGTTGDVRVLRYNNAATLAVADAKRKLLRTTRPLVWITLERTRAGGDNKCREERSGRRTAASTPLELTMFKDSRW
ncbi:hypothetical protein QTP88_000405 [Uroleucon formosanum]